MQTAYACLSGLAFNPDVVLILVTSPSLRLTVLLDLSGKILGQTQAETLAATRSHRDWQTLPPVVTMRCLAIHLEGSEIRNFGSIFHRVMEFDSCKPRFKFWLKIRSCHLCKCCSLTFAAPRHPGFLSPIPHSRDEALHIS